MSDERAQVLIVGGGLVGLSAALFLRTHGVDTVLVERHPGTAIHPRTPGYNPRTMELFRTAGVEQDIRRADQWDADRTGVLWVETLAGRELGWMEPPEWKGNDYDFSSFSPTTWDVCRQDRLEPVLRAHAERRGASLRFGTVLASFEMDEGGVTAELRSDAEDEPVRLRTDYLIAADGAGGALRERLGIDVTGIGALDHRVSMWFRADLSAARRGRGVVLCVVRNRNVRGTMRVSTGLCALTVSYRPELGEGPADFTEERCVELVRAAVGIPDLDVEITDVGPWALSAAVATTFRQGRAFLVGDAAHVMPPAGAYGANTGIQDAHNLAWKLAFVLGGHADPELLDSYEAERRPVAEFTAGQTVARWYSWFGAPGPNTQMPAELTDDLQLMFGYQYFSDAVLADGAKSGDPVVTDLFPGSVGVRMPHLWLDRDGDRVSTIDLPGSGFVLLTDLAGSAWWQAAAAIAARTGIPLARYRVGAGGELADVEDRWPAVLGVRASGAVLIRPDGFVAWRARSLAEEPERVLEEALGRLLRPAATPAVAPAG